jgi:hypothetical protein
MQGGAWQWSDNAFSQLETTKPDSGSVDLGFIPFPMQLYNRAWEADPDNRPFFIYGYDNPAGSVRPWRDMNQGMSVIVGEPRSTDYWRNTQGGEYNSQDTLGRSTYTFNTATAQGRSDFIHFLTEVIPDNYYVFVFSAQRSPGADFKPEEWAQDSVDLGTNIFQVLEEEGALQVRTLEQLGAVPYSIIYQKGKGVLDEALASSPTGPAEVVFSMPRYFTEGSMSSVVVGPARSWKAVGTAIDGALSESSDSVSVEAVVLDAGRNPTDTLQLLSGQPLLMDQNDSTLRYVQFKFYGQDEANRTLPPIQNWYALHAYLPDYILLAEDEPKDTLQQGEPLEVGYRIKPLPGAADSITLKASVVNEATQAVFFESTIMQAVDEEEAYGLDIPTADFEPGNYQVLVRINADSTIKERYYFNNLFIRSFHVKGDIRKPYTDVTFNGQRILDNDIVSANSTIIIEAWDENPYLLMEDTTHLEIRIERPDGTVRLLHYDEPGLRFYPASEEDNRARVEYDADFEQDGEYELEITTRDVSGNRDGEAYRVRFRVFSENSISNVLNYPNPFTTSTQFVYTLTGQPPADFRIRIATVSGRVVRELTQAEIGPLKVGTHRTAYAWNGTDAFGDRLANGVYLYRIVAWDEEGKPYKNYQGDETARFDSMFQNGWGKMVLMR